MMRHLPDMVSEHPVMLKKSSEVALVFAALACITASCGTQRSTTTMQPVMSGPHCAFADPVYMTSLGVCYIAGDYYVAHREWPLTEAQLKEQLTKELEAERADTEDMQEGLAFFDCFTLLDLRRSGEDLVMHYRFKIEGKTVDQTVTLKGKQTVDEILQTATAKGYE